MANRMSQRSVDPSHAARLIKEGGAAKKQDIIAELNRRQVQFSESMGKSQLRELLKFSMELVLLEAPGILVKRSTLDGASLKPVKLISSYADGGHYNGELKEGLRCGHGVHTLPDGGFYEGQWENDQKNGQGFLKNANGNVYDGEWKDDKKHGHGVTTLVNGSQHIGEWKNDKRDGKGALTNSTGKYDGMWMNDMKHGYGVFTWSDGLQYNGEFFRENVFGKGTYSRVIDDFTIEHNGYVYRTLGDHRHADPSIKFEVMNKGGDGSAVETVGIMRELPNGWELAPNCSDSKRVCAEHDWQAVGLVLGDGSAIFTARATQLKLNPGDPSIDSLPQSNFAFSLLIVSQGIPLICSPTKLRCEHQATLSG